MRPLGVHESTGLPLFNEDDVAWYKPDILAASKRGAPRFLRRTNIFTPQQMTEVFRNISLPAFLALADAALTEAADAIGVGVVSHEWGLVRLGPYSPFHQAQAFTPPGYRLVASVANIVDAQPLPPEEVKDVNRRAGAYMNRPHQGGYYASDISAGQCVVSGITRLLIDPEPILEFDM